jgi:ABC-type transporter Mla subunit MlaD
MRRNSIAANPVLIGAATTLVVIVAVFLAYNANSGLPFVPTYDLSMQVKNAANLVEGNEVRIGGTRVGIIDKIDVKSTSRGTDYAVLHTKLETSVQPLPVDSTILIRPRSALGLKYVQITKGTSTQSFPDGGTIPLRQARPEPVEFDDFVNMFSRPTRFASRVNLFEFGNGFSGRGTDLNQAIEGAPALLRNLIPVAQNLANRRTRLGELFQALGQTAAEVAPVGGQQASLFVNLDTTFGALAKVARPYIQDAITNGVPAQETAIRVFPEQQVFLANSTKLLNELEPATVALRQAAPPLADAVVIGTPQLKRSVAFNQALIPTFKAVQDFATDPQVTLGVQDLTSTFTLLQPTLAYVTPAQTVCNYASILLSNAASLLSEGDNIGTAQRFAVVASAPYDRTNPALTKNNEGQASSAPANGPNPKNYLHANNYPDTASPGQPKACMAGNEQFIQGKLTIGNPPAVRTTKTAKTKP